MRNSRYRVLFGIFTLILTFSCTYPSNSSIVEIRHGSQFGMCEGYCYSEIFYNNKTEKTIAKAWGDTIANPTKTEIKEITKPRWKELINSINLSEFYSLASTIGCPDCADGGESWIEIKTTSKEYRVNYEYGKTPKPIEKLIELIEN